MKSQTNLSLDPKIKDKAIKQLKAEGSNLSQYVEGQLKLLIGTTIKDVNENDLFFKCAKCGAMEKEGFMCELTLRTYCLDCHDSYNWNICNHREHSHFRIPFTTDRDIKNREMIEEDVNFIKKSSPEGSNEQIKAL